MSELHELMEQYAAMRSELDPLVAKMDSLKSEIVTQVRESKESANHAGVRATYRKGNGWQQWDTKALAQYADSHPEILQFKKNRIRKASVAVSFSG